MDSLLSFLSWQFMMFSLSVAGVMFVVRIFIEYFFKNKKDLTVWEDLVLPILPLVLGCIMGWLIKSYPYPEGLVSNSGHIIFGMVAGMFSAVLYRAIKALLNAKIGPEVIQVQNQPVPCPVPQAPVQVSVPVSVPVVIATPEVSQDTLDSIRNSIAK